MKPKHALSVLLLLPALALLSCAGPSDAEPRTGDVTGSTTSPPSGSTTSSGSSGAAAGQYTCYRRVSVETCDTNPESDICKVYTVRKPGPNGSIAYSGHKGRDGLECEWLVDAVNVPMASIGCDDPRVPRESVGGFMLGWTGTPYEWCSFQPEHLDMSGQISGEHNLAFKYWVHPEGALTVNSTTGCNVFDGSCQTGFLEPPEKHVIEGHAQVQPLVGLDGFDVGVYLWGDLEIDRQGVWSGAQQVIYHYEDIPLSPTPSVG